MRTAAQETAPLIVLRNCSKEVGEKVSIIYVILVKGEIHAVKHIVFQKAFMSLTKLLLVTRNSYHLEGFSPFLENWAHKIGS